VNDGIRDLLEVNGAAQPPAPMPDEAGRGTSVKKRPAPSIHVSTRVARGDFGERLAGITFPTRRRASVRSSRRKPSKRTSTSTSCGVEPGRFVPATRAVHFCRSRTSAVGRRVGDPRSGALVVPPQVPANRAGLKSRGWPLRYRVMNVDDPPSEPTRNGPRTLAELRSSQEAAGRTRWSPSRPGSDPRSVGE